MKLQTDGPSPQQSLPDQAAEDALRVKELLGRWTMGDLDALGELLQWLRPELQMIAKRYHRSFGCISLNQSDIFNEFAVRLLGTDEQSAPKNQGHFLALAATIMRHLVIDHARRRRRRPQFLDSTAFDRVLRESGIPEDCGSVDIEKTLALEEALNRLEEVDPRKAKVINHYYFGALTLEEIAAAMNISRPTVTRDLAKAKAFLKVYMGDISTCG